MAKSQAVVAVASKTDAAAGAVMTKLQWTQIQDINTCFL